MNIPLRTTTLPAALAIAALVLPACQRAPAPAASTGTTTSQSGLHDWHLPMSPGAAQPDLVATPGGRLLLSWFNRVPGRRTALQFAEYGRDGRWQGAPRTIAVGDSFFVNWADTPHIAATDDGALWVHWLQKSAGAPYAYDVLLSRSLDGGFNWSPPVLVNTDGKQAEHGFVSLWPQARDSLGVAWLDGRNSDVAGDGHGGMMSLRSADFSAALGRRNESELDASTCDCCQTDVALTTRGPLLAYRDRTAAEIRDIYTTRRDGERWTTPRPVHADGWKMPACPVNGPAIAASGNDVVVAWYTAADKPAVKLARSHDAGDSFAAPVTLDQGEAVQGRVDVALDAAQAWVLWVREDNISAGGGGQSLWLARYAPDLSRELSRVEVAKLQGRGKGTGFPQLALRDGNAYLVWTDIVDGAPQLRGAVYASR